MTRIRKALAIAFFLLTISAGFWAVVIVAVKALDGVLLAWPLIAACALFFVITIIVFPD